jgi:hypothetical protein
MKKKLHPKFTPYNQGGKNCKLKHNEVKSGFGRKDERGTHTSLRITEQTLREEKSRTENHNK